MQPSDPRLPQTEAAEQLFSLLQKALGHELPNQLIAVQGLARLLQSEVGDRLGNDGQEYLQRLAAAAQRSHEMVRALADFLRALRTASPITRVALPDVIREATAELNLLYPGRQIEYHFPETGPYLLMPAIVVRQIAGHLLRNALQSSTFPAGPGRAASGSDRSKEEQRIDVGVRESDSAVLFWVRDHGAGWSREQMEKLFEPFACRDTSGAGFGLGLVLARQLVENWGGSIAVESEVGRGSTITVQFQAHGLPSVGFPTVEA
jgi:signal transduction histidine kinase